jgi:hypothetical protein
VGLANHIARHAIISLVNTLKYSSVGFYVTNTNYIVLVYYNGGRSTQQDPLPPTADAMIKISVLRYYLLMADSHQ